MRADFDVTQVPVVHAHSHARRTSLRNLTKLLARFEHCADPIFELRRDHHAFSRGCQIKPPQSSLSLRQLITELLAVPLGFQRFGGSLLCSLCKDTPVEHVDL